MTINYRTLFKVGLVLLPIAIIFSYIPLLVVVILMLAVSLSNKEKWGRGAGGKPGKFEMGLHSYGTPEVRVWNRTDAVVRIGKYTSIADNVKFIVDGNHPLQHFSTFPFFERLGWKEYGQINWGKETPSVGNDVWIGSDVTIYSGVHIGDGAVVAGQSVVTKSVPPYAVVAGNPAVIKKYRFDENTIKELLEAAWWDLPEEVIKEALAPHVTDIKKVCEIARQYKNGK